MNRWNQLPTEILNLVFEYFETTMGTLYYPKVKVSAPSKAMFQCRLTCKGWSSLAEKKIYRKVVITSGSSLLKFLEILKQSSKGELVDSIVFLGNYYQRKEIKTVIPIIASSCPRIRCFDAEASIIDLTLIKEQKILGHFSYLQHIPSCELFESQYNDLTNYFQKTLHDINIFDNDSPKNLEFIKNLPLFTSLKTLHFSVGDFKNVLTVDQHIKTCPAIETVSVSYRIFDSRENDDNRDVFPCSNIRQAYFNGVFSHKSLFSYVIQAFPRLEKLRINNKRNLDHLTTDKAIQFIKYMMKIGDAEVTIPVNDIEGFLNNLNGQIGIFSTVSVMYENSSNSRRSLQVSSKNGKLNIIVKISSSALRRTYAQSYF